MSNKRELLARRTQRTRAKLRKGASQRARLSVFRSNKHIYAQVIDDSQSRTVVAASSLDTDLREGLPRGSNLEAAIAVGKLVAQRAVAAGIKDVVFDRGGMRYHGRIKALADAAREGGLNF